MRRMEWIPWAVISIVGVIYAAILMTNPDPNSYTPITVELMGTFTGFLVALSIAELIKSKDKLGREKKLTSALIEEVKDLINVEADTMVVITDMWEMAITSGDLCLFDIDKLHAFSQFYSNVKLVHEVGDARFRVEVDENEEMIKIFKEELEPIIAGINKWGRHILKKYS